ncbi:MAG: DUF4091 domain-containing protein, partial [Clostridia bacterium]|nr:DUF4091 domain-containing protein [Clostridia bacterium]
FAHYIELPHIYNKNTAFKEGDYVSDAIFPIKTAYEYGMTTVPAGSTQSVYIEVKTTSDMIAGVYTSNVVFKTDRFTYKMPITVTVWNFDISNATVKNYMGINYRPEAFGSAELDSTEYMNTIYFERALEYKMNSDLPYDGTGGPERYVQILKKYYNWPNFTTYRLFYQGSTRGGVDTDILSEYLRAVIEESVKDRVNYLSKAMFYMSNICDEPVTEAQFNNLLKVCQQLQTCYNMVNGSCEQKYSGSDYVYYSSTIAPTMYNIPNVMPDTTFKAATESADRGAEITNCPQIQFLESEGFKQQLHNIADNSQTQKTIWYYTCCNPDYPYPSYHINDFNINFRMMYWMQEDLGLDGYLCWSSAMTSMHFGINPYENDSLRADTSMRMMQETAGDGFFFYPGFPYGIEGPVASLRAVTFRDGQEDAECIRLLKKIYAEKGISADSILKNLYSRLYVGTVPYVGVETFVSIRNMLGEMIEKVNDPCGVVYKEITYADHNAEVTFACTRDGAEVYYKNQLLTATDGFYKVQLDLREDSYLDIKVVSEGKTAEYSQFIAGRYHLFDTLSSEAALERFRINSDSAKSLNTDAAFISEGETASIKLAVSGRENAAASFFPFFAIEMNDLDVSEVSVIGMKILCNDPAGIKFSVNTFNGYSYVALKEVNLQYGWNDVSFEFQTADMSYDSRLYFKTENLLDGEGNARTVDLYVNRLFYLGKEGK